MTNETIGSDKFYLHVDEHIKAEVTSLSYASSANYDMENPFQKAQQELFEKRNKFREGKLAELHKIYKERLDGYLGTYFNGWSDIEEENEISYDTLNKSWVTYCVNANRTQKYVDLKVKAFEEEVTRIISENPQFQPKVVDFTKLNEVI